MLSALRSKCYSLNKFKQYIIECQQKCFRGPESGVPTILLFNRTVAREIGKKDAIDLLNC